jgi:erythromycin esterase
MSTPKVDAFRDSLMAENVQWILEREESLGRHSIFISAHNGHIKRVNDYRNGGKGMGHLLADRFGKTYYAIGTDFYRSCCNLPKNPIRTQRANHTFFSRDPLAKAAKHCGFETCWLDFAKVPDGSSLQRYLNNPINMGSLGEVNYSFLMRILPRTFRSKGTPRLLYNSMIFVPVAHPTAPNVE